MFLKAFDRRNPHPHIGMGHRWKRVGAFKKISPHKVEPIYEDSMKPFGSAFANFFAHPVSSSGRSGKSSTLRAPQPEPARRLGLDLGLGKTAHLSTTEPFLPVIPHTGTKLGALARRKGLGCGKTCLALIWDVRECREMPSGLVAPATLFSQSFCRDA